MNPAAHATPAWLPLVWDDAARHVAARPALASILRSARKIGEARGSCIVLLRDAAALEVICAHRVGREEFLATFGSADPAVGADSLVSLPFTQGLRQRGALCLFGLHTPQLSALDLELLEELAGQAEFALAVASQQNAIDRLHAALCAPQDAEPLLLTAVEPSAVSDYPRVRA